MAGYWKYVQYHWCPQGAETQVNSSPLVTNELEKRESVKITHVTDMISVCWNITCVNMLKLFHNLKSYD